ncbi:hypothetical protein KBD68_04680 [Candidatus Woesebacteria bacterium]|nr:hypothetical protein [Candidatus Woesebacteria bacterium]
MNDTKIWRGNYILTIRVAIALVLVGILPLVFFDSKWLNFWGVLIVLLGLFAFFMAHTLKKKYLQPSQSNLP